MKNSILITRLSEAELIQLAITYSDVHFYIAEIERMIHEELTSSEAVHLTIDYVKTRYEQGLLTKHL